MTNLISFGIPEVHETLLARIIAGFQAITMSHLRDHLGSFVSGAARQQSANLLSFFVFDFAGVKSLGSLTVLS